MYDLLVGGCMGSTSRGARAPMCAHVTLSLSVLSQQMRPETLPVLHLHSFSCYVLLGMYV